MLDTRLLVHLNTQFHLSSQNKFLNHIILSQSIQSRLLSWIWTPFCLWWNYVIVRRYIFVNIDHSYNLHKSDLGIRAELFTKIETDKIQKQDIHTYTVRFK